MSEHIKKAQKRLEPASKRGKRATIGVVKSALGKRGKRNRKRK